MIADPDIHDAVWNRKVAGKFAGLEYRLEIGARKTRRNDRFRRRVAGLLY